MNVRPLQYQIAWKMSSNVQTVSVFQTMNIVTKMMMMAIVSGKNVLTYRVLEISTSISYIADPLIPCHKNEFMCTDKMCIPEDLVCDGKSHCFDDSDEKIGCQKIVQNCKGFVCKNKVCLRNMEWLCDGRNDCGDNSDEENCVPECK